MKISLARLIRGFSLIEVTLSIGVASFALVALLGVLPVGLGVTKAATEESQALNITSGIIADLRSLEAKGTAESPQYRIRKPGAGSSTTTYFYSTEGGKGSAGAGAITRGEARFLVAVRLTSPSTPGASVAANIMTSWPPPTTLPAANAPRPPSEGMVETFATLKQP